MATYENKGIMTYIDESGNHHLLYPETKPECVDGLDDLLGAKAAARNAIWQATNAVAWYRVGEVAQYHSCRITISSGYATREDMCVVLDALATYGSPVLNKVSEAYTNSNVKVIDQVRLVKDTGKYYVDIHYNHIVDNNVWVTMDGADGYFEPSTNWVANPEGTAAVTLAL